MRNALKNPIHARFCWPLLVLSPLTAQGLTEAEAVKRTLTRPEWQAILQLPASQGEGAAAEARTWLAPGLEWSRERFTGIQPGKREDTIVLTQGVDLSGRWRSRREAALKRAEAGKAGTAIQTASVAAQVREAFFDVVAARERVTRLDRALARLGKVQDQVDRLHAAGELSGLDRGRVHRELATLRGRQVQEQLAEYRAEARLAALLGDKVPELQDALLPPEPEPLEQLLSRQQSGPVATWTRAAKAAAEADARAARRWMPDLQVGLGVKRWQENGLSGNGSVLSLGLALPMPGRVKGQRMKAEAEARAAAAQARLQREQEEAELRAVWQEASTLRASAGRMSQEVLQDPARVEAALEAAFAAGEVDLLARLDGVRSLLEAELAALDQVHRARRACIALDRLLGKVNP